MRILCCVLSEGVRLVSAVIVNMRQLLAFSCFFMQTPAHPRCQDSLQNPHSMKSTLS